MFGKYCRRQFDENGDVELVFKPVGAFAELIKDQLFEIKEKKKSRTLTQNAYMWALIRDIAVHRGGKRAITDEYEIYVEALINAGGINSDILIIKTEAIDSLKKRAGIRAVQIISTFLDGDTEYSQVKVFYGSSSMTTDEFGLLIEAIQDMAVAEGIELIDYEH